MIPNIRHGTAGLAALLMLAALFCAGMQAAMAEENEMTIGIGDYLGNGTDPTIYGNYSHCQQYTHWEPLITLDNRSNIIPWMAESYEKLEHYYRSKMNPDGSYTFSYKEVYCMIWWHV